MNRNLSFIISAENSNITIHDFLKKQGYKRKKHSKTRFWAQQQDLEDVFFEKINSARQQTAYSILGLQHNADYVTRYIGRRRWII